MIRVGDALRVLPAPEYRPVPCPECRADMREVGCADVRDPIDGGLTTLCSSCAATYKERRLTTGIRTLMERSGMPRRYWAADEALVPSCARQQVASWAGDPEFLLLLGATGCGKSFAAGCIVRRLLLSGERCWWVSTLQAIREMKGDLDNAGDVQERLERARILVLDDLGSERLTDYAVDVLVTVISARWDACRPTIVTTNLAADQLHAVSARMASRLLSGLVVAFPDLDRRLERGGA